MKKRIFPCIAAFILTMNCIPVHAEEVPVPFDVEDAVYAQLMKYDYFYDENEDEVITEEEMRNCTQVFMNLDGITDISWLAKLENATYVSFEGGTLTDFSVLKDMPKLRVIDFEQVPVSDISYLKDKKMEAIRLHGTDQISLEQRLEILEWNDITIGQGFSDFIRIMPVGMFDDYTLSMRILDESVAEFTNRQYGYAGQSQHVYGIKPGSTTYEMLVDDKVVLSGKITVTESEVYDPPLHEESLGDPMIFDSFYHGTYNVVLRNGTLYGIKGASADAVQENVKDFDRIYMKDEKGTYQYADLVLLEDGTLLVNGETITDQKFVELENGCVITEDNVIYTIYPLGGVFKTVKLGEDFKEFPYTSNYYYTSQSGEVIFYKVSYNTKDEMVVTTTKTGIKNPIAAIDNLFIDEKNVLWTCKTYPGFSKSQAAKDAVDVSYIQMTNGGAGYAYTTKDGTIVSVASGTPVTPVEEQKWQSYLENGSFYLHDYMEKLQNENDCLVRYFILDDRTLTISFVGKNFAITNVEAAICADYDAETQQGYVYFLRTDGSLWRYALDTQECVDLDAEETQPTEPQPTEPEPTESEPTESEPTEPQPTETQPTEPEMGDVNGDKSFTVTDVIAFQRWLLNDGTKLANTAAADFNEDSLLNAFDLGLMKRMLIFGSKQ
ncbi:MAG: hypothetical protein IKK51_00145 [Oscillospiraceae bacterium]|nr:hypothetical protein [Oscillospiraceae bacterium]